MAEWLISAVSLWRCCKNERDQILNATVEDIHALAPLIQAVLSDDQLCVVGSENAIEKAKDVFMETKPLVSC